MLELNPPQPDEIVRAVEQLVAETRPASDPWWAAGIAEALGSGDSPAAQDAWRGAGVIES